MQERGQAFAPFRLLIGVIMGLLILLIILGAIDYFHDIKIQVSENELYRGFLSSVKASDGSVVERKNLLFDSTTFASVTFGSAANIPKECISFEAVKISAYVIHKEDGRGYAIDITKTMNANVYFKCEKESFQPEECDFYCRVRFGDRNFETG